MQSNLFTTAGELMNFDSFGKWIGGCGKFFMFSNDKVQKS